MTRHDGQHMLEMAFGVAIFLVRQRRHPSGVFALGIEFRPLDDRQRPVEGQGPRARSRRKAEHDAGQEHGALGSRSGHG